MKTLQRLLRIKFLHFLLPIVVGVIVFSGSLISLILAHGGLLIWTNLSPKNCDQISSFAENWGGSRTEELGNSLLNNLDRTVEKTDQLACRLKLIQKLKATPEEFLNTFQRQTSDFEELSGQDIPLWTETLESVCRESEACAKRLIQLAMDPAHSKNSETLQSWIIKIGEAAEKHITEQLTSLNLGFHSDDTEATTDDKAEWLVQVLLKSPKMNPSAITQYLKNDRVKMPIRFRVAFQAAQWREPTREAFPLIIMALSRRETQLSTRLSILGRFAPLAATFRELSLEFEKALSGVEAKSKNNDSWTLEDHKIVVSAILNYKKYVSKTSQNVRLDDVAPGLVEATTKQWGFNSPENQELISALEGHPLLNSRLPTLLIQSQGTVSMGFRNLGADEKVTSSQWSRARLSIESLKIKDRVTLFEQTKHLEAKSILFASMTSAAQQTLKKSDPLQKKITEMAARDDFESSLKIELMVAAGRFSKRSPLAARIDRIILNQFNCSPTWLVTTHHIVESGPKTPGYGASILQLMSCPPEQLDSALISESVFSKESYSQIQRALKLPHHATPTQLQRLTDILGQSNRTPGSSLPPKIKK